MKTIVFAAQKGGCGKSTSAIVTAYALAAEEKTILFIDADAQCNSSEILTSGTIAKGRTLRDVLTGKCKQPEQALCPCEIGHIIASDAFLSDTDIKSTQAVKAILDALRGQFDYAILDTPPALSMITLSAMAAADFAVIPSRADPMGCTATRNTLDSIRTVQGRINKGLRAGVLPTQYNARATLNRTYLSGLQDIAKAYGAKAFPAIRSGISVAESQALHRSLFDYAPKASVTGDYRNFIEELKKEI